ncbi:hypothetical protein K0504_10615 [Neiella marina]|uniref:Uncharacterized protein n=1 Tax=Neiella holothuriorum TaxID=2870530 RepID=A0ABS7EGZ8_9GAMM|nr:hypothetical protein [Neiella holothuriorum]MBW8191489.1 hypothetical protein [Neiella holothuriorum]
MPYQQSERVSAYLVTLHEKLLAFYRKVKHGNVDELLKSQTQGYIQAGIVLSVLDHQSARACMEKAHFEIFQQTIDERLEYKQYKQDLLLALDSDDDGFLDQPAITRTNKSVAQP